MLQRFSLPFVVAVLPHSVLCVALVAVVAGCSSHPASGRADAATPLDSSGTQNARDADNANRAPDGANSARDASNPMDSANAIGDASNTTEAPLVGNRADAVVDAAQDERVSPDARSNHPAPIPDSALSTDLTQPSEDASACTPEQDRLRNTIDPNAIIPYDDVPAVVTDFLTSFLSVDYITEHFQFIVTNGSVPTAGFPLYFYFIDGCYTDTGQSFIQWGVPICQGKVRYVGPSREWRVLVDEADAKALIEAAGCDSSNMQLTWGSEGSPIPGVNECSGISYYPAWQAGGQSVNPVGLPPGSYCQAATCMVNAETGAISSTPQYCEVPG